MFSVSVRYRPSHAYDALHPLQPALFTTGERHWGERRFRITRGIREVLAEQSGIGVTIITKSPLVTREIDVLLRIHERSCAHDYQVGERYRTGLRRRFAAVCATHGVAFGRVNRPEDEADDDEMALAAATAVTAQLDLPL